MTSRLFRHTVAGLALLAVVVPAFAQIPAPKEQGTFEFYLGQYTIPDARFKEIYGEGGTVVGLSLSSSLAYGFDFYVQLRGFSKKGKLTFTEETTTFLLIPLSLGVRYVLPGSVLRPFAGGGADFYFYYENNPIATTMNVVSGYHLLGGLYVQFGKDSPLRLFGLAKYTRLTAREGEVQVELGGLEYGGGITIVF
jgi:hypothetical protein